MWVAHQALPKGGGACTQDVAIWMTYAQVCQELEQFWEALEALDRAIELQLEVAAGTLDWDSFSKNPPPIIVAEPCFWRSSRSPRAHLPRSLSTYVKTETPREQSRRMDLTSESHRMRREVR